MFDLNSFLHRPFKSNGGHGARLIFFAPEGGEKMAEAPAQNVQGPFAEAETKQKNLAKIMKDEAEPAREAQKNHSAKIAAYNQEYADQESYKAADPLTLYAKPLEPFDWGEADKISWGMIDLSNDASIITHYAGLKAYFDAIDAILNSQKKEKTGVTDVLSIGIRDKETKALRADQPEQAKALEDIKAKILTVPDKLKAAWEAKQASEQADRKAYTEKETFWSKKGSEVIHHEDTQQELQKKPGFQTLNDQYTSAVEGMLANSEFSTFWKGADMKVSEARARENHLLFLSILREESNQFNDDFPLGPAEGPQAFANDPIKNRENYPYLYNLWMEYEGVGGYQKVDLNVIAKLQVDLNQLKEETKEDINTLTFTKSPAFPEAKDAESSEKRAKAIVAEIRLIEEKITNKDIPEKDKEGWTGRDGKVAKLKKHEELAEKQAEWFKEEAKSKTKHDKFTREFLRNPENHLQSLVMEFALKQYKRASELVDRSFRHGSGGSLGYSIPVRRMLIAMIYKKGVGAAYTEPQAGDLVNHDGYSESDGTYNEVLVALLQSSQYNAARKGRFIAPEEIQFLDLATSARTPAEIAFVRDYLNAPKKYAEDLNTTGNEAAAKKEVEKINIKLARKIKIHALEESGVETKVTLAKTFIAAEDKYLATMTKEQEEAKNSTEGAEKDYQKTIADATSNKEAILAGAKTGENIKKERAKRGYEEALRGADRQRQVDNVIAENAHRPAIQQAETEYQTKLAQAKATHEREVATMGVNSEAWKHSKRSFEFTQKKLKEELENKKKPLEQAKQAAEQKYEQAKQAAQRERDAKEYEAAEAVQNAEQHVELETRKATTKLAADKVTITEKLTNAKTTALAEFKTSTGITDANDIDTLYTKFDAQLEAESQNIKYTYFEDVNFSYVGLEREKKSDNDFLDLMGIQTKGFYEAYAAYIKTNPDLVVDNWTELFTSDDPARYQKLVDLFEATLPKDVEGGKKSFLAVFAGMKGYKPLDANQKEADPRMLAITVFNTLRQEIIRRNDASKTAESADAEYVRRVEENLSIGDRAVEYGKSVIDMLIGPGKSPADRAAGAAILFMAYKAIRKAFGDTPGAMGTALRYAAIGAAVDIVVKRQTGRGLSERFGIMKDVTAIEGTYDAALIKFSEKEAKSENISESQHLRALHELKKIPFYKTVEWYESVRRNKNQVMPAKGEEDKFRKLGVNAEYVFNNEQKFSEKKDPEIEGRRITFKTIEWFLKYMGHQQTGGNVEDGLQKAKEIYIYPIKNPELMDPEKLRHSIRSNPIVASFKDHPDDLTWKIVEESEVDLDHVDATKRQNAVDKTIDVATEVVNSAASKLRTEIMEPVSYEGKQFYKKAGNYAGIAKTWALEMAAKGGRKVHFAADRIVMEYDTHRVELRRIFDEHVSLLKTGILLPFKIIIAADRFLIPLADETLRKAEAILRQKYGQTEMPIGTLKGELNDDFFLNSEVVQEYLGARYNQNFFSAFTHNNFHLDTNDTEVRGSDKSKNLGPANVAYFITATEPQENEKGMEVDERLLQMHSRAWEEAKIFFLKQIEGKNGGTLPDPNPYTDAYFEKYLYPISAVSKVADGSIQPEKMYVFWRMPAVSSPEYLLKEQGEWTGPNDPNRMKDVPPFIVDPTKSLWANLQLAYGPELNFLRPGLRFLGKTIGEWIRLANWALEKGEDFINVILGGIPRVTWRIPENAKLTEQQKIWLDEKLTTASDADLAMSEWYSGEDRDKVSQISPTKAAGNRKLYKENHGIVDEAYPVSKIEATASGTVDIPKGTDYFVEQAGAGSDFYVHKDGRLEIEKAAGAVTIHQEMEGKVKLPQNRANITVVSWIPDPTLPNGHP